MRGSPVFLVERQKPTRTMYPDEEQRITTGVARRIGLVLATGLIAGVFCPVPRCTLIICLPSTILGRNPGS